MVEFLSPDIVTQFVIFFVLAAAGGIIAARIKQPAVIMLLAIGAIIGPNALGIVNSNQLIDLFLNIGSVFLLFAIGVEFSVAKLISLGFRAVIITVLKMGTLFLLGYQIGLLVGLDHISSLFLGAVFSITSTTIMSKMLEQKGLIMRTEFNLLFSMLVVEDIIAVTMITFLSSLRSGGGSTFLESAIGSVLLALAVLGISYTLMRRFLQAASPFITKYQTEDTMIFLGIGLATLFSLFASAIGLTPAIGAFIAGSVIASMPNSQTLSRSVRPFVLAFSALFFLSIGMLVHIPSLTNLIGLYMPIILLFALVSFLVVTMLTYLTGFRGNSAIFSGCAMVVVGEFSLLIAALAPTGGMLDMLALASLAVLVTAIISSLALDRTNRLLRSMESILPGGFLRALRLLSNYFGLILAEFEPGGKFSIKLLRETRSISTELMWIAIVGAVFWTVNSLVGWIPLSLGPVSLMGRTVLLLVAVLVILYPLSRALGPLLRILYALSSAINKFERPGEHVGKTILRNIALAAVLFAFSIAIQLAVYFLRLPWVFQLASIPFTILSFLFLLDITRHVPHIKSRLRD